MERKDFLRQGGPCFYFDTELFAPTTDSFALGWFAAPKRGERVCDLGSGTGCSARSCSRVSRRSRFSAWSRTLRRTRSRKRALPKTAGRSA